MEFKASVGAAILEQMTFIHLQKVSWGRRLSQNRLFLFWEQRVCWQELGFHLELRLRWQQRKTIQNTDLLLILLIRGLRKIKHFQWPLGQIW